MLAKTLGPALAAGNVTIVKPAEQTSLSALFIAHLSTLVPLPPGVFNVLTGDGQVGKHLVEHEQVDKVTFTGSTEVGQSIMAASGLTNLKRVTLELGGKSPLIIFDDVDPRKAAKLASASIFVSNGQVCCCASRTYVHEKIYKEFVEASKQIAQSRVLGDQFDERTEQGPQIDEQSADKIETMVAMGIKQGARLITGGKRATKYNQLFYEPTILVDVNESMSIAREEIFGPVQLIIPFRDFDDVARRVNETKFGLAAGIVTNDMSRSIRLARLIKAGSVWLNCYFVVRPSTPFGGFKKSGIGREFGEKAIEEYVESKTIVFNLSDELIFG